MSATNLFGRNMGEKRIELILNEYPDLFSSNKTANDLINVKGFAKKTAEQFVEKLPLFVNFVNECGLQNKLNYVKNEVDINHELYNKKVVVTGFRDKNIELKLKEIGAILNTTVTSDCCAVIAKSKLSISTKLDDAKKYNIPIYDCLLYTSPSPRD